jgi:hypothetical protein
MILISFGLFVLASNEAMALDVLTEQQVAEVVQGDSGKKQFIVIVGDILLLVGLSCYGGPFASLSYLVAVVNSYRFVEYGRTRSEIKEWKGKDGKFYRETKTSYFKVGF